MQLIGIELSGGTRYWTVQQLLSISVASSYGKWTTAVVAASFPSSFPFALYDDDYDCILFSMRIRGERLRVRWSVIRHTLRFLYARRKKWEKNDIINIKKCSFCQDPQTAGRRQESTNWQKNTIYTIKSDVENSSSLHKLMMEEVFFLLNKKIFFFSFRGAIFDKVLTLSWRRFGGPCEAMKAVRVTTAGEKKNEARAGQLNKKLIEKLYTNLGRKNRKIQHRFYIWPSECGRD